MSFTIKIQRLIDGCIFKPLCSVLSVVKGNSSTPKNVKKILVIKFWAVGDSITLLPSLYALKKQFPHAELHVLAHPRNKFVFQNQPFIDKIIDFGAVNILKTMRNYDICIDAEPFLNVSAVISFIASKFRLGFSHGARSTIYNKTILFNKKQHMVQNYLDFARILGSKYNTNKLIPMHVPQKDKIAVADFLKQNNIKKRDFVVGITPGVAESVKFRMWPLQNVAQLADELVQKHNAKVVFIDIPSNKNVVDTVRSNMQEESIDATSLKGMQLTAITEACSIFIGNDSGFMHTAAAQGVKTIGLFGPNTPTLWGPYGKGNISLFKPKQGCPFLDNTNPQLIPKHLTKEQETCMDAISVQDVMHAVEKLMKH